MLARRFLPVLCLLVVLTPSVLQRQLSDFYIQYTLVARLDNEAQRVQTLSDLHAAIQDEFNEFGVQIMSPHFMEQPNGPVKEARVAKRSQTRG